MRRMIDRCTGRELVDYGMGFVPAPRQVGQLYEASEFIPVAPVKSWTPLPPQTPSFWVCQDWFQARPDYMTDILAAVRYHGEATTARAIDSVVQGGALTVEYFPGKERLVPFLRTLRGYEVNSYGQTMGQFLVKCVVGNNVMDDAPVSATS